MENKKKYIMWGVIAVIFISLYIVLAIFVGKKEEGITDNYLLVGNTLIWHEKASKWYQETEISDNLSTQRFTVLTNKKEYTAYNAQYVDNNWYFFNKNYKEIGKDFKVAYSGDINIKLINYKMEYYDDSDDQFIEDVAHPTSESQFNAFRNLVKKITYDFDNDDVEETLYTITSSSLIVTDFDQVSYMFVVKNNKIISKIKSTDSLSIVEVFNLNGDNEIVVLEGNINNPTLDDCYQIYKIKDNKLYLSQNCLFNE